MEAGRACGRLWFERVLKGPVGVFGLGVFGVVCEGFVGHNILRSLLGVCVGRGRSCRGLRG